MIHELTEFFKWCVIWGVGFYMVTAIAAVVMPGFIYKVQSKFFPLTEKEFQLVIYKYIANFKLILIVFMIVPYLALLSMG